MTITAIQPFYRAGVLIAAGPTQLSYSASDEADLVRRGVAAYVGSNPQTGGTVPAMVQTNATTGLPELLGPDGTYAALPLDANGNATANINHRTGLLDSLLGLPGGAGEIGVATDIDALVVYSGVTGEAVPFYRNGHIGTFAPAGNTTVSAVASGATGKVVTFSGAYMDAPGFLAAGGDNVTFVVPASSAKRCAVEVACGFYYGFTDSGTGTVRKLILQYDTSGSGAWADLAEVAAIPGAGLSANANSRMVGTVHQVFPTADTAKFRLIAKQDSGGALDLTIINLMIRMHRA